MRSPLNFEEEGRRSLLVFSLYRRKAKGERNIPCPFALCEHATESSKLPGGVLPYTPPLLATAAIRME
jgi:hypothetical protein